MHEVSCVGVLGRYWVGFLCLFAKQLKQQLILKGLLRVRLVESGDCGGSRRRIPSESGSEAVRLTEYGPVPPGSGNHNPENRYIANATKLLY